MKKEFRLRILSVLAAALLLGSLVGCAGGKPKQESEKPKQPGQSRPATAVAEAGQDTAGAKAQKEETTARKWRTPTGWFYKESFGKGEFIHMPVCIAADSDRVVVVDSTGADTDKNTQVVIFGHDMKVVAKVEIPLGSGKARPHGVAIGPDGTIYLGIDSLEGDQQTAGIGRITKTGTDYSYEYVGRVDEAVAEYGIAVDSSGTLYMADAGTNRIIVDALGRAVSFPGPGDTEDYPTRGMAVEPGGSLLTHTMKGGTFKLVRYSKEGKVLAEMPVPSVAERLPWHYDGIDVSPDGKIFLADYGNKKVLVLSKDGNKEASLTCDTCRGPVSVAVAPNGKIYVADFRSKEVHCFEPMY